MITNLNSNYSDTSFGMKFQTERVIGSNFSISRLSSDSDYFAKRLAIPNREMAMRNVKAAFRQQYPELATAIDNKVGIMMRNHNTAKDMYLNDTKMSPVIKKFIQEMGLKKVIDIEI